MAFGGPGTFAARAQAQFAAVLAAHGLPFAENPDRADDYVLEVGPEGPRCVVQGQDVWVWLAEILEADELDDLWPDRRSPDLDVALAELLDGLSTLLDSGGIEADAPLVRIRVAFPVAAALVAADAAATLGREVRIELVEDFGWIFVGCDGEWSSHGVDLSDDPVRLIVHVAEQVQDVLALRLWSAWPVCPAHPTLGLHAELDSNAPVWRCRAGDHVAARIGSLAPPDTPLRPADRTL